MNDNSFHDWRILNTDQLSAKRALFVGLQLRGEVALEALEVEDVVFAAPQLYHLIGLLEGRKAYGAFCSVSEYEVREGELLHRLYQMRIPLAHPLRRKCPTPHFPIEHEAYEEGRHHHNHNQHANLQQHQGPKHQQRPHLVVDELRLDLPVRCSVC